ncbi:MAG: SpoIIE family protein phosphatase [Gemmatimonadota bacterium]|nr:SpoIIE family protein phosphatase [Gemmatimonadota bacterium]
MFRIQIVLVLLLVFPPSVETAPVMDWTVYQYRDGLAHNVVTSVVQARDGAMWFATRGGISRYDGQSWRTYREESGLPDNGFSGLFEAENGTLWATGGFGFRGRQGHRIARLADDRWEPVMLPETLEGVDVGPIVGVAGGGLCFATAGLGILHYADEEWKTIDEADGLASNYVQCLLRSKDGAVWAAYAGRRPGVPFSLRSGRRRAGGMSRFDPAKKAWAEVAPPGEFARGAVTAMAQAVDGAVWLGTENHGILRYDGAGWQVYDAGDGMPADRVLSVASAPDGSIWVGTVGGAVRFTASEGASAADGRWRVRQVFTEDNGLPNNLVTSVCVSNDGAVWLGTAWGVARYGATNWEHHSRWAGASDRGGVALERTEDGRLWAATGERVYEFDGANWIEAYRIRAASGRRRAGRIVALSEGTGGTLWAAVHRSVMRFDGANWKEFVLPVSGPGSRILSIFPARTGGVWAGAGAGLFRFDGDEWTRHAPEGTRGVSAVYESDDGVLWYGANGGIVKEKDGGREVFNTAAGLPGEPVVALGEALGAVWAATRFTGMFRYDRGEWQPVPTGDQTVFGGAHRLFVDDEGILWLATLVIGAVHTDGVTWTRYTTRNGLPGARVWDVAQDRRGRFWFATDKGLGRYTPDTDAPETRLSMPSTEVAPYQSVLFKFSGQDAWKQTPPQELKYAWRVDGGDWSTFTSEDQAFVGRMVPGPHTFEVRAMDRGFNVDATPARHIFVVLAPVWQRPWFVALSVFSIVALCVSSGYALHRHRRWREAQARQIHELESELEEAHRMQMGLLPTVPIRTDAFEIAGVCAPANHVGGDYFDYFWLDEARRKLGFGAADVSGKAMEAAVRAMQLSGIFRYEFRGKRPLNEVATRLDEDLREQMDEASFVTCCLGTLDLEAQRVQLINAAHPFPYHYCARTRELREIQLPSIPLGMVLPPGSPGGRAEATIRVAPDDLLVFYSDGVTDMRNATGEFYETDRLEQAVRAHIRASAADLVSMVLEDVYRFKGDAPQTDDITLLVIRMLERGRTGA